MKFHLSPQELGQAIGVSKSSLTRWVDDGVIQAPKTAGGHRRIPITEAVRFIRESGLPVVKPSNLGFNELNFEQPLSYEASQAYEEIRAGLREGDGLRVRRAMLTALLCGESVPKLFDGPLVHAMAEIGELWHHDEMGIVTEHRATDICIQALNQLRSLFPPPEDRAPVAVGGALEGDPYLLPSLMVATTLAFQGWHEMNLGPQTPASAIAMAAGQSQAELVYLSVSVELPQGRLAREIKTLIRDIPSRSRLLIGGRFSHLVNLSVPEDRVQMVSSMAELAAFARGLYIGATQTGRRARSAGSEQAENVGAGN